MAHLSGSGDDVRSELDGPSSELFAAVAALVGDRMAECRRDEDGGARVTVLDLTEHDRASIERVASDLGIAAWTRIEQADPAARVAWERLRLDLIRLRDQGPAVLRQYPTPRPGYRRPPVQVSLDAGPEAVRVAAELYARHGDFVMLRVGALRYPLTGPQPDPAALLDSGREQAARVDIEVELDGPLTVASGETVTHALRLRYTGDRPITVNTNAAITATIVDPVSGAAVGGFAGAQHQPLVTWLVSPGQSVVMPLLVGTASRVAALGYAVPAGRWQLIAPLDLADGRRVVAGPLDFTILDPVEAT